MLSRGYECGNLKKILFNLKKILANALLPSASSSVLVSDMTEFLDLNLGAVFIVYV